jgi:hypothetical protein
LVESDLLEFYYHTTHVVCETFLAAIGMVATGTIPFEKILKDKDPKNKEKDAP